MSLAYMTNITTAFYIPHAPRIMWAGLSILAQQQPRSHWIVKNVSNFKLRATPTTECVRNKGG
eukprot:8762883-Ditylum_brightwellii.AAC.1